MRPCWLILISAYRPDEMGLPKREPALSDTRPWWFVTSSSTTWRHALKAQIVASSSASMNRPYRSRRHTGKRQACVPHRPPATGAPPKQNEMLMAVYGRFMGVSNGAVEGHTAHRPPMSAFGYKRTLLGTVIYVRFAPESGHSARPAQQALMFTLGSRTHTHRNDVQLEPASVGRSTTLKFYPT